MAIDRRPIPEVLLLQAKQAGLTDREIAHRWQRYLQWLDKMGYVEYRIDQWDRHIGFELKDREITISPSAIEEQKQRSRAWEEREYGKSAVSFADYIASDACPPSLRDFVATHPKMGPLQAMQIWAEDQTRSGRGCACDRCRTVAVVDDRGGIAGRRLEAPPPQTSGVRAVQADDAERFT